MKGGRSPHLASFREVTALVTGIAAAYVVRAIAPEFMRRSTNRVTLEAMARQGGA